MSTLADAIANPSGTPIGGAAAGIGAPADAVATTDTGTFSLIALLKRALGYLATMAGAAASTVASPVALATDHIATDTASLTPKFAKISTSASGASTVVALVAGKKIRVLQFWLTASGAVNAKFQSHIAPTDLTGLLYMATAGDGAAMNFCPVGLFETVAGEALDINLSGAVAVGGGLVYVEV